MEKVRKIKQYNSQIDKLKSEVSDLKLQVSSIQTVIDTKRRMIVELMGKLNKISHDGSLKISEHAMLRYMERYKGLNLQDLQNEIISDKVKDMVEKLGGTGKFPNDNFSLYIKDYTVVTIV